MQGKIKKILLIYIYIYVYIYIYRTYFTYSNIFFMTGKRYSCNTSSTSSSRSSRRSSSSNRVVKWCYLRCWKVQYHHRMSEPHGVNRSVGSAIMHPNLTNLRFHSSLIGAFRVAPLWFVAVEWWLIGCEVSRYSLWLALDGGLWGCVSMY